MREWRTMDAMAKEDRWVNRIHPLVKFVLTIFYIAIVVSFHKYDLAGLLGMILYPLILFLTTGLSFREALYRLRFVLPIVCAVGIFNPFFDREVLFSLGPIGITGGILSMITLIIKAILTVLASYLLIATTSIEKICYAMTRLHVPKIFVTEILLIYRYIDVLLGEVHRTMLAYSLRAPGQKGVAFRAWGPLVGRMLLRSMDRATQVYESMCLRGFRGEFYPEAGETGSGGASALYFIIWLVVIALLRAFPLMSLLGGLVV